MASTKDMTLLPREVLVVPEAIRLGGGGQVEEWRLAYSPLEGEGRLTLSAAKCETGRGDLSTRALLDVERPSPHPAASRRPTSELRSSRTPPGAGKDHVAAVVTPPSTTMVWPVMKVEASDARYATAPAISSGSPMRRSGEPEVRRLRF